MFRGYVPPHGPLSKRFAKSQAVRRTFDLSIIEICKQNSKESPLLNLPREIRDIIYMFTLGGRLIHIKHFSQDQLKSLHRHTAFPEATWAEGAFRHIECIAHITEFEAYHVSQAPNRNTPPSEDSACYVQSSRARHSVCTKRTDKMYSNGPWIRLFEQSDFLSNWRDRVNMCSLLGTSRQIYAEASEVLWSSNTFSFDDPHSFREFLQSLTLPQKRQLTAVHIECRISEESSVKAWNLLRTSCKALTGLKTFHLCLEDRGTFQWSDYRPTAEGDNLLAKHVLHPWLELRQRLLENVTIIVSDEQLSPGQQSHLQGHRSTVQEKSALAERICTEFKNPVATAQALQEVLDENATRKQRREETKRRKAEARNVETSPNMDDQIPPYGPSTTAQPTLQQQQDYHYASPAQISATQARHPHQRQPAANGPYDNNRGVVQYGPSGTSALGPQRTNQPLTRNRPPIDPRPYVAQKHVNHRYHPYSQLPLVLPGLVRSRTMNWREWDPNSPWMPQNISAWMDTFSPNDGLPLTLEVDSLGGMAV